MWRHVLIEQCMNCIDYKSCRINGNDILKNKRQRQYYIMKVSNSVIVIASVGEIKGNILHITETASQSKRTYRTC